MSNNVRIWARADKKSEAAWLGFLLTLTGCQVWKGNLSSNPYIFQTRTTKYRYIDILLFETIDWMVCGKIADTNPAGTVLICGNEEMYLPMGAYSWRVCRELRMDSLDTLIELIQNIYPIIMKEYNEMSSVLHLTDRYAMESNKLARAMYTITELFCSRREDYSKYDNGMMLLTAAEYIEQWYQEYIETFQRNSRTTYIEAFALTYLQNLANEGYAKAGMRKAFPDEMVFANTSYLMKLRRRDDAVLSLRLMAMHNADRLREDPIQILDAMAETAAPEYMNQAYCEAAEIYRRIPGQQEKAIQLLEKVDRNDAGIYQGLYKLGLLYEAKGERNLIWYKRAEQEYRHVIKMLDPVKRKYRTLQEYEYFCKAKYRKIKMQFYLREKDGYTCQCDLEELMKVCEEGWNGMFMDKFFHKNMQDDILSNKKIRSLMKEKMSCVKEWADNLYWEIG